MKKLISLLLCLLMIPLGLFALSCKKEEAPGDPDADGSDGNLTYAAATLGLDPVLVRGESDVATAVIGGNGELTLTALRAGEAAFRVENHYSEAATVTVTVDDKMAITAAVTPFAAPEHAVNVRDFGALGDGKTDDSAAFQEAIDSLTKGGTVYVPAGIYMINGLEVRQGIHVRLYGNLPDAKTGYDTAAGDYVKSGQVAVLRRRSGGASHLFYNLRKGSYCTKGVSNIAFSGGVMDCTKTAMPFVWVCGQNILFENCIVKDIPNNHAIQIDGCEDVVIRNIMFAGYEAGDVLTRETIQIEPTTPGAIGAAETSPVKCDNGDFHYNKNISITGCYFGKSDQCGPHQTALGHHSFGAKATCDGLEFSDNIIDDPLLYGVHLNNFVNVEIKGNTFISTRQTERLAEDTALINLYANDKNVTYTDERGYQIMAAYQSELEANRGYTIEGNRFLLGGNTHLRPLSISGTAHRPGAVYLGTVYKTEQFGGMPYSFSGYTATKNVIADIRFTGNTVEVQGGTAYGDHLFYAENVYGLTFADNTYPTAGYSAEGATLFENVQTGEAAETRVITAHQNGGVLTLETPTGQAGYICHAAGSLTLTVSGNGRIETVTDQNGRVTVAVEALANFWGWFAADGETPVDLSAGFSGDTVLVAKFR